MESSEMEASGMFWPLQTVGRVLCCMCGLSMEPNAANMCIRCLSSRDDITEGLQKCVTIIYCPECRRYLQPPRLWIKADLESPELLTFCIKRLKNMNTIRLVHAVFIRTEEHSKRLKLRLTIEKEVFHGTNIQASYIVDYTRLDRMCEACTRSHANPDQWFAAVYLRQHVPHRRTFFYLEQLILKHEAALMAVKVKEINQGIDFYFSNKHHAEKFVGFLRDVVPIKKREDKQLLSHDVKSSIYRYRYTFSVEICPICREDLVFLDPKVASSLGNIGPLLLCVKVCQNILMLDPFTLRSCSLDANQYWRNPLKPLLGSRQIVEYIILDVEAVNVETEFGGKKYCLAEAQVARVSDFGKNDTIFTLKTHLGHVLKPGDYALGYDLYGANLNGLEMEKNKDFVFPDVILVKKSYDKHQKRRGKRLWKLKTLNVEIDNSEGRNNEEKRKTEYEEFLKDLEENIELMRDISLYRTKEPDSNEEEDVTPVPLDELLATLAISDVDDVDEIG